MSPAYPIQSLQTNLSGMHDSMIFAACSLLISIFPSKSKTATDNHQVVLKGCATDVITDPRDLSLGNRMEGLAMNWAWAQSAKRFQVVFGSIAHVLFKAIAGIEIRHFPHLSVFGNFCQDACGQGNRI